MSSAASGSAGHSPPAAPVSYSNSESVREFLVLQALNTSTGFPIKLQETLGRAFEQVTSGIQLGKIALDYAPGKEGVVDIPSVNHPLYMQALLYWCGKLSCTLDHLAEAHARLGKAPTVEQIRVALVVIANEDLASSTVMQTTRLREGPKTIPMAEVTGKESAGLKNNTWWNQALP